MIINKRNIRHYCCLNTFSIDCYNLSIIVFVALKRAYWLRYSQNVKTFS